MKSIGRLVCASIVSLLVLGSCAEEETASYNEYEGKALKAWMAINHKDLLENYQKKGGYYVDVERLGETTGRAINDTAVWVKFTFTGRDLSGNVALSRDETIAAQQGVYTKYTRYVPLYKYCASNTITMMEGTTLAFRNELTLGEEYAKVHGFPKTIKLYYGTKVKLYMPSSVVGSGLQGSGGYEGQYALDAGRPLVVTMEVTDTIYNPLRREGGNVDMFAEKNGTLKPVKKKEDKSMRRGSTSRADDTKPYDDGFAWRNAVDSIPQVYVNYLFKPETKFNYTVVPGIERYKSIYEPYAAFDGMETQISEALVKRFHKDKAYEGLEKLTDTVKLDGTAKIWYIGRFLDGFIFDTNIDEVKKIIYGEVKSKGTALSYVPKDGGMIQAFYYTVPNLRYGQWAALITTSTNAYGSSGKNGSTTTSGGSSSSNYDYMNYYNYANNYYGGNGYYGGYYNGYYGNYGNGMYGGMYGNGYGAGESTTTTPKITTVSTEIPAFTPLIFELYIEPKKK
ncbi:MAG: hypothetical protein RR960_01050 [Alistipes sp.]